MEKVKGAEAQSQAASGTVGARRPQGTGETVRAPQSADATLLADRCFDLWGAEGAHSDTAGACAELRAALRDHRAAGGLLGLLGKCQIRGCDVHVLTLQEEIVRHLAVDTETPTGFSAARDYWQSPHEAAVAVLVYTDHADVLLLDGTLLRLP